MTFELDKKIAADTAALGETEQYVIRLANDSRFPWVILIPKIAMVTEVYQLDSGFQQQLALDSAQLGQEMMALYKGDSFNSGALGNVVRQLHIHHVVRFENDNAWPGPIWGFESAVAYSDEQLSAQVERLRVGLSLLVRHSREGGNLS